jgi:hypothetical protein
MIITKKSKENKNIESYPPLRKVLRANIDDSAADGPGRVKAEGVVLVLLP